MDKSKASAGKVILIICIGAFFISAGAVMKYIYDIYTHEEAFTELAADGKNTGEIITDKGVVSEKYAELYLQNNDIIGWIKIPETRINYPVMQTPEDPEYYLHRNFEKEDSDAGTPFMDCFSNIFIPTGNFLIYGHNMSAGTMFHDLLKYSDRKFYEEHKTFQFDTIYSGGQGTYEVIAAGYSQIYPENSGAFKYYMHASITEEKEFTEYVKGVKELSVYETGVGAEKGDQLVTLSTCAYHTENGRFFVVGKRIDGKNTISQYKRR